MSSIHVNKKEFQNYKECSHPTASNQYGLYLELAGKQEPLELTIYDISRIDNVPLEVVEQRTGKKKV